MPEDPHGRTPFRHPALEGIDDLTEASLFKILDRNRLSPLARSCGITSVMRWLPKRVSFIFSPVISTLDYSEVWNFVLVHLPLIGLASYTMNMHD